MKVVFFSESQMVGKVEEHSIMPETMLRGDYDGRRLVSLWKTTNRPL